MKIIIITIFALGLSFSLAAKMNGDVLTPAQSFFSTSYKFSTMNQKEIWSSIKGYEDIYEISNIGRVKSLSRTIHKGSRGYANKKEMILKPSNSLGYSRVFLLLNGNIKAYSIHRLVALVFIPNPQNKPTVNHKNSIRNDNRVENLEWATHKENSQHGYLYGNIKKLPSSIGKIGKLNSVSKSVMQFDINNNLIAEHESIRQSSICTNINNRSISMVCHGERKTAGGYKWKFKT